MSPPADWFTCPVCGAEVRAGALSCKECGSDDRTGWSAETEYDGLDIPETDEDEDIATNTEKWMDRADTRLQIIMIVVGLIASLGMLIAMFIQFAGWR